MSGLWWSLAALGGLAAIGALLWRRSSRQRGVFVMRELTPDSVPDVRAWAKEQGIATLVPELHVTVCFSRAPFALPKLEKDFVVVRGGERSMHVFGPGALVLVFESEELQKRHAHFRRLGASFDFPEYNPHVSLTYINAQNLVSIRPFEGQLVFGPEKMRLLEPDEGQKITMQQRRAQ
jgi:hypothetical protein